MTRSLGGVGGGEGEGVGGFLRKRTSLDCIIEDPQLEMSAAGNEQCTFTWQRSKAKSKPSGSPSITVKKIVYFTVQLLIRITISSLQYIICLPLSIATPSFWLSAFLWIFWKILRFPFNLLNWLLRKIGLLKDHRGMSGSGDGYCPKRTVLLSCGSSIQTLHLARNFYSSGLRVIVFEFEDLFGLARFSAAVDNFYLVPRPKGLDARNYIEAICHIVRKEKPVVYIPVCATNPAYYDALAKPHLELLGCSSFIPGVRDIMILDDCWQFFLKCSCSNISLPPHLILRSMEDLTDLYTNTFMADHRNLLISVGSQGLLERRKYILPKRIREFKFDHEISEQNEWLLVRDLPGDHFLTCTTIKDSRIIANIVCTIESDSKKLVPIVMNDTNYAKQSIDLNDIEKWISIFFSKARFQRPINGYFTFRLVRCQNTGLILPLGIRVGVSQPYICNTHNNRSLFRTINASNGEKHEYSFRKRSSKLYGSLDSNVWSWPAYLKARNTGISLDKHETLFTFWDPLPYCAFYHLQMPLESVRLFLKKRQGRKNVN